MITLRQWLSRGCAAGTLLMAHQLVSAQVVVTYGPASSSIPTLSEWGMLAMAALLVIAAAMVFRRGAKSHRLMSVLLGAAALVMGGAHLSHEAQAVPVVTLELTVPTGGTLSTDAGPISTPVVNRTPVPQRILSITPPSAIGGSTPCLAGSTVLSTNASCTILTIGSVT